MNGLLLLLLLLFWLLPSTSHRITQTVCVLRNHLRRVEDYYSPGDLIIGGNLLLENFWDFTVLKFNCKPSKGFIAVSVTLKNYHLFLALVHAVTKSTRIWFCFPTSHSASIFMTIKTLLGGFPRTASLFCLHEAEWFQFTNVTSRTLCSLSVLTSSSSLRKTELCSLSFRINPHEFLQYVGLVRLLLHFQWNWVGLVAPEGDNGERFISTLMPMLKEKEICPAFTQLFKSESFAFAAMKFLLLILTQFKAEVIILFGESKSILTIYTSLSLVEKVNGIAFRTVWILTSHWEISSTHDILPYLKFFHGALHFRDHSHDIPEFRHLLLSLDP
ncbi:hypothetical protein E2320_022268 [Naja naja]|nr:hypothetical protein E2320_022268 [Naja naja]